MSDPEDEGAIEFLDEDADIVQQCVHNADYTPLDIDLKSQIMESQLLVERVQERPKRKRKTEEDSDYNPEEDIPQRNRKRRQISNRGRRAIHIVMKSKEVNKMKKKDPFDPKMDLTKRRQLDLRVPDYEDPLCLPVRAIRKDSMDVRKLRSWNNLCLEHFKHFDTPFRAEQEPTVSSKRTVVLRNLYNKMSGKMETSIYSKISIENKKGEKKSEVIQSVLPKYREKKLLNNYKLVEIKKPKSIYDRDQVILSKEVHKDVESLVVYKPERSLSLIYKMFELKGRDFESGNDEGDRKYLKEVGCCKVCAPCYQTSWRGFKNIDKKTINCSICKRPCISVYNLLSHLKSHSDTEVRAHRRAISMSLAAKQLYHSQSVEYHYKCRICQKKLLSIKDLRTHVRNHKGTESFKCEVCNHVTN